MVEHFSIVETGHCSVIRTPDQVFPFDFKSRNSNSLLVTIGDSWTWGDDITPTNNNQKRLDLVFGNILSLSLECDWLNLGQCGSGNFWLAEKVQELVQLIPSMSYKKIYVICTLTEVGREFNSGYDNHIDYISFLNKNPITDVIKLLNEVVAEKIKLLTQFDNVILRVGTNFVDHIGLDAIGEWLLPTPWLNLIAEPKNTCFVVGSPTLDNFKRSGDLFPDYNKFLLWLNQLSDAALIRQHTLRDSIKFKSGHPLAHGHRVWAEHILKSL